jgi:lipopolysaccharide export system ATP-binding protein
MTLLLQKVSLSFSGKPVVRDVSLALAPGEVVGLLGPNGAGKTTTFNLVTGMLKPDLGDVLLDNNSIKQLSMPERARKGIGYLAQEASIFRNLSVRDNLLLAMQQSGVSSSAQRGRLEELVIDFQLERFLNRKGFQLSGGERRRTEVARALAVGVSGPRFLLLDEPFAGVDPLAVNDLQQLIISLRDRGVAMLITDHNVRETLSITDRAYILTDGSILASGTAFDLANNALVQKHYLGEGFVL